MSTTIAPIEKKKMLAPKLRFNEFNVAWIAKSLSELLEFKNGINASKEQYGTGIKFINVLDILNNEYITYDSIIGSVDVDENVASKYPVNYGDILFQRSSETRQEVGTACVYLDRDKTAVFGGFVIRGRKIGEYDPIFLNKLLKTDLSRNEITSKSGGSTRYNVGQETLSSITLKFPLLPEQQKIASFLSSVDEKIQPLTRKKELLEQYKKGVMQQLFLGKLRFKDENGKAFPKWEEKRLGEITTLLKDGSHGSHKDSPNSIHFLLSAKNIIDGAIKIDSTDRRISEDDYNSIYKNYNLQQGDILLTIVGTIGRVAIFKHKQNVAFQRSVAFFRFNNQCTEFIFHLMTATMFQKELDLRKVISAQPGIYLGDLAKIPVTVPCLEEQKKIANYLSSIDTKIEIVNKQITQTQTFKKGLLQQMFV